MAKPSSSSAATIDSPIAPMGQSGQLPTVPARAQETEAAAGMPTAAAHPQAADEAADPAWRPHAAARLPINVAMRGQKMQFLWQQAWARGTANQLASVSVLPLSLDSTTLTELMTMQMAVLNRLEQLQRGWMQGLGEIVQDYAELRLANTLSKFVEQEYNLGAQVGALWASQAANLASLMENMQVDYAYWLSQKRPA